MQLTNDEILLEQLSKIVFNSHSENIYNLLYGKIAYR